MVESPLLVRPYVKALGRGELSVLKTAGMATIAGTVMVLYSSILGDVISGALGHILTASLLSVPATITIAALMVPLDEPTPGDIELPKDGNAMAAITRGTMEGVTLLLGLLPDIDRGALSLERILGWIMAPIVFLMGIPWSEA